MTSNAQARGETPDGGATDELAWDGSEQARLASLGAVLGAPTTGRVVHTGPARTYYEADPEFRHPQAGSVATRMLSEGLDLLGGLLCRRFGRVLVRGFARPDGAGDCYGLLLLPPVAYRAVEFLTPLADGRLLLTSTHPGPGDDPGRGLLRERAPGERVEELFARHQARLAGLGARPAAIVPTLAGLARALDGLLDRVDA